MIMTLPIELMPAAGWCKTVEQVKLLAKVPTISHSVMGSFTVPPRDGNTGGTTFWVREDGTSFNALGMPNGGLPYLKTHLREMVRIAHDAGKIAVLNIAGDTPGEYMQLAVFALDCGMDIIEFNFGCPNKFGTNGAQKEIASYNTELMDNTMRLAASEIASGRTLWAKLSPYANPEERVRVAQHISAWSGVSLSRVTLTNTYANCVPRDDEGHMIITAQNTNGRGGMAGTCLRDIALANAEHFLELLPPRIGINGAGGIDSGKSLAAYHRIGCVGAQIGTAFFNGENFRIFEEVASEFMDLVA